MLTQAQIFTTPDPTLTQEGSVDPMGMQMIWTDYGQKIFNNKLTTVSTDIRNYTINLFHHYLLYTFEREDSDTFQAAKVRFKDYTVDYDTKAGILIFLEDLLLYSILEAEKQGLEVDTSGMLGSFNARRKWTTEIESIVLEAEKNEGVFVRQIVLGVNGRYKGPFISMGLFKGRLFGYNEMAWPKVKDLMEQWEVGMRLAEKLTQIMKEVLSEGAGDHPRRPFTDYQSDRDLQSLYAQCFGQKKVVPHLREFWERQLGLRSGAAISMKENYG